MCLAHVAVACQRSLPRAALQQGFVPLSPSCGSPFSCPLLWYLQGLQKPYLPSCPSKVLLGRRYGLGALSRDGRNTRHPSSDPTGLGQKTEPMPGCSLVQEIPMVLQLVGSWCCSEPELGRSFVRSATSLAACAADTGKSWILLWLWNNKNNKKNL